ncbi:AAA family ATPase [Paenibacillus xanthanilyticus]|uniref:AAA family ATPase n=1 Tax=Paenibacillus xanthanilyticus TaxID=1783531 RepID=A0ABV8JYT9_9BACL
MLYIFGGLPGAGKSTLSAALAREIRAAYLRVDVVEHAIRAAGGAVNGPEGYVVCYGLASHNLRLGLDVVADTVNPLRETRQAWRDVAQSFDIPFLEIEVICSDVEEHKQRVETRVIDIPGFTPPTWAEVQARHYEHWDRERIVIDTARHTPDESIAMLRERVERARRQRGG